jgi:hypothetical protein
MRKGGRAGEGRGCWSTYAHTHTCTYACTHLVLICCSAFSYSCHLDCISQCATHTCTRPYMDLLVTQAHALWHPHLRTHAHPDITRTRKERELSERATYLRTTERKQAFCTSLPSLPPSAPLHVSPFLPRLSLSSHSHIPARGVARTCRHASTRIACRVCPALCLPCPPQAPLSVRQ